MGLIHQCLLMVPARGHWQSAAAAAAESCLLRVLDAAGLTAGSDVQRCCMPISFQVSTSCCTEDTTTGLSAERTVRKSLRADVLERALEGGGN